MLLVEYEARLRETTDPMALSAANLRSWGLEPRAIGGECRRARAVAGDAMAGQIGGFSHDSEHDLAMMVSDFLENGSSGAESRYSSDSDSGKPDLSHLADRVLFYKHAADQYESDLLSAVHSLLVSIDEKNLHVVHDGQCNASCIRYSLVKLLRLSGYDAAVCSSKWQGYGKVPGGDHEYIDVVANDDTMTSERFIIDIDFRSHFEIARAVTSYDAILCSLPVVYVGSQPRLKQFLQIMADAAKYSLKQNSMPLPPWRSLAYLQAKWQSKFERKYNVDEHEVHGGSSDHEQCVEHEVHGGSSDHEQCVGHLRRLKSSIQSEMEMEGMFKPITNDKKRRVKSERLRPSFLRC